MSDLATVLQNTRAWACYDCGKCTSCCPITLTGADYSPRRHVLATNLGQANELLEDKTLFSCLTCSQCDQRCPAEVDYTSLIQKLREAAYKEGVEPSCPHGGALQSMMRMMATGGTQQNRLDWLSDDLQTEAVEGKVFYWTGCTMYYDAFFPEFNSSTLDGTKAAIKLMNKLGDHPVVSPEERCCGHDLLWNGDRKSFEALARHNIELVAKSKAEVLVTSCAECLRTWMIDYQPYFTGKQPRIMHISELIAEHLHKFNFSTNGSGPQRVTFQDPCRMGRHLGLYDSPRDVLNALPGVELAEMQHNKRGALCCAGGTWSDCDRFAKQIQTDRLREARATGAEVLVTACPKCQIHFNCAIKDPNLGDEIRVEMRDVAELVIDAL